jgi:hypothetical protein
MEDALLAQEGQQHDEYWISGGEDDDTSILSVPEASSEAVRSASEQGDPDTTIEGAFRSFQHDRKITEAGIYETLNQFNPDPERWLVAEVIDTSRPLANQGRSLRFLRASHRSVVVPLKFDGRDSDREHFTMAFLDRHERSITVYDPQQDIEYIRTSVRCCETFASGLPPFTCQSGDLQNWESNSSDVCLSSTINCPLMTADIAC